MSAMPYFHIEELLLSRWGAGHPLAPIRLANDARASTASQSGKTQGKGMPLHFRCYMKLDGVLLSPKFSHYSIFDQSDFLNAQQKNCAKID